MTAPRKRLGFWARLRQRLQGEGLLPLWLALMALVTLAFFGLPLLGLLYRVPWSEALEQLGRPAVREALRLSFVVSAAATAFSMLFGFPTAWCLVRLDFRGRDALRRLVLLPMVLPPVVGGVALLAVFGRLGWVGAVLDRFGWQLPFSTAGAVLAATFVAAPFAVLALESGLAAVDEGLEEAAATLGASRWRILRSITLPAMRPALAAALALTWARALGEFGATITFAGNIQGRTRTMPLAVIQALQTEPEGAFLLSALLLFASLLVLLGMRGRLSLS